jgi:hypothetical protein
MAINTLEMGFFDDLVRGGSRVLKTPEQVAEEFKFHIQKELDAQLVQSPFTVDDIPIDSFQRQNTPQTDNDDDQNGSNNTATKPLPPPPRVPLRKIKQWLG